MSTTSQPAASPTPILDGLAPLPAPPKQIRSSLVGLILGAVLGAVLGSLLLSRDSSSYVSTGILARALDHTPLLLTLLWLFVSQYIVVTIHECGHALLGIAVGMKLNFLRIGPIQINREGKFSRHKRSGTGAGGMASLIPPSGPPVRSHMLVMLSGGVLANFGSAAIVWLIDRRYPLPKFFGFFVFISLVVAVMNCLPFRYKAVFSDGYRIYTLLFRPDIGRRWMALNKLTADLIRGVPPEDFDRAVIADLTALKTKSTDTVAAHALAYTSAYYGHRDEEAAQHLELCLNYADVCAPAARQVLAASAGVFQARRRANVTVARKWLAAMPAATQIPGLRELVEAAICEAQGDRVSARAKLDESAALLRAIPAEADRNVRLANIERWKRELDAVSSAAAN